MSPAAQVGGGYIVNILVNIFFLAIELSSYILIIYLNHTAKQLQVNNEKIYCYRAG